MAYKAIQPSQSDKIQTEIVQYEEVADAIIALQDLARKEGRDAEKMPGLHLLKKHIGHGSLPRIKMLREVYQKKLADEKAHPVPDPISREIGKAVENLWRAIGNEMDLVVSDIDKALEAAQNALKKAESERDEALGDCSKLEKSTAALQERLETQGQALKEIRKEKKHLQDRLGQQKQLVDVYRDQLASLRDNFHDTRNQLSEEISTLENRLQALSDTHAEKLSQSEKIADEMKQQLRAEIQKAEHRIEELGIEKNNAYTVASDLTGKMNTLTHDKEQLIKQVAVLETRLNTCQQSLDEQAGMKEQAEKELADCRLQQTEYSRLKEQNEILSVQLEQLQKDYRDLSMQKTSVKQ